MVLGFNVRSVPNEGSPYLLQVILVSTVPRLGDIRFSETIVEIEIVPLYIDDG
jgi:hypothetical protein